MKRKTVNRVIVLSLLLSVVSASLFARSNFAYDSVLWMREPRRIELENTYHGLHFKHTTLKPESCRGLIDLGLWHPGLSCDSYSGTGIKAVSGPSARLNSPTFEFKCLGFGIMRCSNVLGDIQVDASLPTLPLAIAFAVPPFGWAIWRFRRLAKKPPRLCPRCRYDLHATPARCPECGHEPTSPPPT